MFYKTVIVLVVKVNDDGDDDRNSISDGKVQRQFRTWSKFTKSKRGQKRKSN